jgi:hypothetical protein
VVAATALVVGVASTSIAAHQDTDQGQGQQNRGQGQQGQGQMGQQGSQGQQDQSMSASQLTTEQATITKIDKNTRMLSLKDQSGDVTEMKAGPDVKLDQLKVGDMITTDYYQEIVLALRGPGQPPPKMSQTTMERGGVTARQMTLTARVTEVDASKNTVTIRGPQGSHTLHVSDPGVQQQLGKIKAGDTVDVTYTQAIAMSVQKPEGKGMQKQDMNKPGMRNPQAPSEPSPSEPTPSQPK